MSATEPQFEYIGPDGVPVGVVRRPPTAPTRLGFHVLLLVLTFLSTTVCGGALALGGIPMPLGKGLLVLFLPQVLLAGLRFSVPLLFILACHEAGHVLACRRHSLDATLPFFLPLPLPFLSIGTLGAFIRIRSRIMSKRELLDVGASGPLAGLAAALPVLVVGIALSTFTTQAPQPGVQILGEPLLFQALTRLVLGPELPGSDLELHPVALAGWFGLLFTMLNLLPFGQLDGGHVLYALLGRWHRRVVFPLVALLAGLGFVWWPWWIWAGIGAILGLRHPWVPDEQQPLDPRRKAIALLCVVVFVVCFMPTPMRVVE